MNRPYKFSYKSRPRLSFEWTIDLSGLLGWGWGLDVDASGQPMISSPSRWYLNIRALITFLSLRRHPQMSVLSQAVVALTFILWVFVLLFTFFGPKNKPTATQRSDDVTLTLPIRVLCLIFSFIFWSWSNSSGKVSSHPACDHTMEPKNSVTFISLAFSVSFLASCWSFPCCFVISVLPGNTFTSCLSVSRSLHLSLLASFTRRTFAIISHDTNCQSDSKSTSL